MLDDLLEASIPGGRKNAPASLAADWTDVESFSRPPHHGSSDCADPEASWGHRNSNLPGPKGEMFFGYYLSAATMTRDENGPPVPELTRRITLSSCHADPVRALAPVLARMPEDGIPLGDILADSGYAHRDAGAWALPLRAAGAQLVQDLHPADRGPHGTAHGAIIANGNLYCPATPQPLLHLGPLAPGAAPEDIAAHDQQTTELARHKLGRLTADDADGYHRVTCPAAMGKLRCPLQTASMTLDRSRPEILNPPGHPPACCTQQTPHHRAGRGGENPAETRLPLGGPPPLLHSPHQRQRAFSTIKDPASNTIAAAGAASWACHHSRSGSPACTPSATSASSPPGTPAGREQPPGRRRPGPQNQETPAENHSRQPHRSAITRHTAPPATVHPHRPPAPARPDPAEPRPAHPAPGHAPGNTKINSGEAANRPECQRQT